MQATKFTVPVQCEWKQLDLQREIRAGVFK